MKAGERVTPLANFSSGKTPEAPLQRLAACGWRTEGGIWSAPSPVRRATDSIRFGNLTASFLRRPSGRRAARQPRTDDCALDAQVATMTASAARLDHRGLLLGADSSPEAGSAALRRRRTWRPPPALHREVWKSGGPIHRKVRVWSGAPTDGSPSVGNQIGQGLPIACGRALKGNEAQEGRWSRIPARVRARLPALSQSKAPKSSKRQGGNDRGDAARLRPRHVLRGV